MPGFGAAELTVVGMMCLTVIVIVGVLYAIVRAVLRSGSRRA
jgi:hypothetical protein